MASLRRRSILLAGATGAFITVGAVPAEAEARYYDVAPGYRLNVRSGPGTGYTVVRVLNEGTKVPIFCQTPGETITGPLGASNIWDKTADGVYVSDTYVKTGSDGYVAQRCSGSWPKAAEPPRSPRPPGAIIDA